MGFNVFNMTQEKMDKIRELEREFDSFSRFPGENTKSIIKRYIHLVSSMSDLDITKEPEEWVEKFISALPKEEWEDYVLNLKSSREFSQLTISPLIKRIEEQMVIKDEKRKEKAVKVKESVKNESSRSASVCSNCHNFKTVNAKLVKDAESLALEFKKLNNKKKADEKQILDLQGICEKLKVENGKLLGSVNSLTLENKGLKENEKVFESKQKSSENEDFWIKLENKNLKANEVKLQEQINVLENEKSVLENLKNENENSIKSHLERISKLEDEAKSSRIKIDELEKKLISFATKSDKLNIPCPKPINSVPISDCVTNFDSVKVEDCDDASDDENVKKEKQKLFLNLKEKFQKTVLQSTEKGECSKQKPLKKKAEQKQKDNKSSSDRSSNQKQNLQKIKNENSKNVGNKWCRSDHSAKASNPAKLRKEYHQAKQCYDLSVWYNGDNWYDNRMCYSCGYHGHIAVNCQYWRYETRRCYNCNIKGHIARDCPRRSMGRSRVMSQKVARIPVKVKPEELKVREPKVQQPKVLETKVKLSQGQKDRLRKKRKKAREYLEKILSSGSQDKQNKSSDESTPSVAKTSKTNSSDTNLRTEQRGKKKEKVGDESDRSKSDKPPAGNDSGMVKPEEPLVEVKVENSSLAMDDANFPPLLSKNSKSPKVSQAWVKLFK